MYEDTLSAKAYGEELVKPEHPQLETYQAIFEAVHEHGDGDYGVTELSLDNGVMLQSEYSGASVFKDGDRVASAQSLSQGSHGIHHPISVEGELSPELQKNIEVSIESLGKSSDRDHDFTGAPATTYERSTLEQSQLSMFDLVGQVVYGKDPIDPASMDATIARDMFGTSVEVMGPPEAVRENENTRFFNVVHAATESRGDTTGYGIRRLDLGDGMAALTDGNAIVISQTDGQGNERVIYEQSKGTSHLSGVGETHSDRIPQATKNKVWEKTVDANLRTPPAKTGTRPKTQKSKGRDDGMERD